MEEEKKGNIKEQEKGKNEEVEEKLPFCTTAPSAEHSRAQDEDEPCDDFRTGDTSKD